MDFEVPIRQRANVFLEIYGNTRVQERTARYIEQLGQSLRALVADGTSTLGLVSLEHLKYRERDVLESVFKSYMRPAVSDFDMVTLRGHRLRGNFTTEDAVLHTPNASVSVVLGGCCWVGGPIKVTIKSDMTIESLWATGTINTASKSRRVSFTLNCFASGARAGLLLSLAIRLTRRATVPWPLMWRGS